jgi:hypothetical protein
MEDAIERIRWGARMMNDLIAPCGMNCGICLGYLREKNRCLGCRKMDESESGHCRKCIVRNCPILEDRKMRFCSDRCDKYPCRRLRDLDKRYRTKYGMSMIENLDNIKRTGIRDFVRNEKTRWKCRKCGSTICVHRDFCLKCGEKRQTL